MPAGRLATIPCLLLVIGALVPVASEAQAPQHWGGLQPGAHGVGFRRIWTVDHSRVWPRSEAIDSVHGVIARPQRIDVWYPAVCDRNARMPLGAYLRMQAPAPEFADLVFLTRRWDEYSYRGLVARDSAVFDRLMSLETAACEGAERARGRFPLVVYSAGWFNRAPDNTILAEFLASHGFVVAAVPQTNPGLWTFRFTSDAWSVENQIRDLELTLGVMAMDSSVDRTRVAAMGYSTGGDVALLLQGRNRVVDAVVGLDASWTLGPGNDVKGSAFFSPGQHRVPILAARRPISPGRADEVLDSLDGAPRLVVEISGSDHGAFSDDPAQRLALGLGTADQAAAHARVAHVVLQFLRATLVDGGGFDGAALARRLGTRGLAVAYRPPDPDPR